MDRDTPSPWRQELDDFARAFSGAFLFGIPLLYTMEMWWLGSLVPPWKLLVILVVALAANLVLCSSSGFRRERGWKGQLNQAVDTVAVGLVGSAIVLLVLNKIPAGEPLSSVVAMTIVQAVPLSIGASVANAVFAYGRGRTDGKGEEGQQPERAGPWRATLADVGATIIGGVFVGANIAPTEEILLLAGGMTGAHLLALVVMSLVLTYAIVFASGFDPERGLSKPSGIFRSPLSETGMAYVLSLFVAFAALYLFNRADLGDPLPHLVAQVLVLGLPTALGGAAGRLVV